MSQETIREPEELSKTERHPTSGPGLVLIFCYDRPYFLPFPLRKGRLELGRDELLAVHLADDRASRRHLAVELAGTGLKVRDLGSTNGVFVNGARISEEVTVELDERTIIRIGRTLLLVVPEIEPFERAMDRPIAHDGLVAGPALTEVHERVAALGAAGQGLFIRGESGSGKEIAARIFHEASPRRTGPLVAVNCATIQKELAERLLFGAVRGAYSGAVTDSQGYLQAARGGTLFLDEVAELDLAVQAKLLRVLETREVIPLGSTRPQAVEFGLCAATFRDLREAVAKQTFREDLYYRIGRPEVRLPPLRERLEEIPHLIDRTVRAVGVPAHWSLVEDCLLRPWPGNVRELCSELRAAAVLAAAESCAVVEPKHLGEQAGRLLTRNTPLPTMHSADTLPPTLPGVPSSGTEGTSQARVPEQFLSSVSNVLGLAHKTLLKLFPPAVLMELSERSRRENLGESELAAELRTSAAAALFELLMAQEFNQTSVATSLGVSRTTLIKLMEDLGLPRAADLAPEEIARAFQECGGDHDAAARLLRVSPSALKKRITQLDLQLLRG